MTEEVPAQDVLFAEVVIPRFIKACQAAGVQFDPQSDEDVQGLLKVAEMLDLAEQRGLISLDAPAAPRAESGIAKAASELEGILLRSSQAQPGVDADIASALENPYVKAAMDAMDSAKGPVPAQSAEADPSAVATPEGSKEPPKPDAASPVEA